MLKSRLTLALVALSLTAVVGCSRDRHEINSTQHLPATVLVIDTVNDTTIWSMDVPAGQRLVWDFDSASNPHEALRRSTAPATSMRWWLFPSGVYANYGNYPKGKAVDSGSVDLPGTLVRTEVVFRESGTTTQASPLMSAEEAAALPPIRLELEVAPDGSVVFDGRARKPEEIAPLFRSLYGERKVVITGKPGTPAANMVALTQHIKRPDLVTVVIPAGTEDAPPQPEADGDAPGTDDAPAEADDPTDAIDDAMEGK